MRKGTEPYNKEDETIVVRPWEYKYLKSKGYDVSGMVMDEKFPETSYPDRMAFKKKIKLLEQEKLKEIFYSNKKTLKKES